MATSFLDTLFGGKQTQTQTSNQSGTSQYGLTPQIAAYGNNVVGSQYTPQNFSAAQLAFNPNQ